MVDLSHLAPEGGTSLLASAEHLGASAALLDAWRRSGVAVLTLTPTVSSLLTKCCYVWGNWLARQPESVKRRYALDAADGGGGWLALGGKEVYEVCLGADLPGSLPLELREFTMEAFAAMDAACRAALLAAGAQLRLRPHGLTSLLDELPLAPDRAGASVLHASRYGGADGAAGGSTSACTLGTEPHTDRGLLTLVYSDASDGLEVRAPSSSIGRSGSDESDWSGVALGRATAALFPGWSLEFATAGAIKATEHRVRASAPGRASLAFKLRLRDDAAVDCAALLGREPGTLPTRYRGPQTGSALKRTFDQAFPASVTRRHEAGGGRSEEASRTGAAGTACVAGTTDTAAGADQAGGAKAQDPIHIFVCDATARALQIKARPTTDISKIRAAYAEYKGLGVNEFKMCFDGRTVEDGRTLDDYDIGDGESLDCFQEQVGD